jgi:hypothetical protein
MQEKNGMVRLRGFPFSVFRFQLMG